MRLRPSARERACGGRARSGPPDLRLAGSCGYDLRPSNARAAAEHGPGLRISAWPSCRAERIADAAHGPDEPRLAAGLGLAPEVADVDVERLRRRLEVVAPDAFVDGVARHDDLGVGQ